MNHFTEGQDEKKLLLKSIRNKIVKINEDCHRIINLL